MVDILHEIEAAVPALRRYARALTRDADRADDLVQDCLERAIARRRFFRPQGPVHAWLFTILVNLHRNQIRDERRRGETMAIDAIPEPAVRPAQPGHLALVELDRAIGTLPLDQKEALLLVTLEGLSYAEAANILDIPLGTLMSRLGRARATLKTLTGMPAEPHLRTVK